MNIPILLIYFNRPEILLKQIKALNCIKPTELYIAADGPRFGNTDDIKKLNICSLIITEFIKWDCKIHKYESTINMGCDKWIPNAINWFFDTVEYGIILEDDCIIDNNFIKFADELGKKYAKNEKIMNVSAANFIEINNFQPDYYFSRLPHNWAWSTWRRAWNNFNNIDINFSKLPDLFKKVEQFCSHKDEKIYWKKLFTQIATNKNKKWDAKWLCCIWINDGYSITPKQNLVTNIGYGINATSTKVKEKNIHEMKINELNNDFLSHPVLLESSINYDYLVFKKRYKPSFNSYFTKIKSLFLK